MKKFLPLLFLFFISLSHAPVLAVETAPRISDREIIESLAELKEGQKALRQQVNDLKESTQQQINGLKESTQKQINDLKESTQKQINDLKDSTDKRFDAMDRRFDDLNSRFDDLRWMLGLFITIALVILGFVLRMQWQMHGRQTRMETTLETHKDELLFLKNLIEKLLPPKGVL
ncbi:MAG: DUF1640 domain-containing protein [Nitrospinae bacterium]|nr:DUF1640 domain-containing protein [Nitrospinota bacterium]